MVLVNFHVASWYEDLRKLIILEGNFCLRFNAPFLEVADDGDGNLQTERTMPFPFLASDLKLAILTIDLLFSLKFSVPEKSRGTNGLF